MAERKKNRTYITTRKVSRIGNTIGVYIPALWDEFQTDDVVEFSIYHIDHEENKITVRKTIHNSNKKGTRTITCGDKSWGFKLGDLVVFSLKRPENDDPGVETEE